MPAIPFGDAVLNRIEEVRIPNKIAYFTQDDALIAAHRDWLSPHFLDERGMFDLVFQSWIVEVGGRVVLIDPCTGNARPHVVPFFNLLDTPYIEAMGSLGYRPQDIDFVVCTHLHHDHCGWNTHLREGRWVPTFPKARYIVQRTEYDRFRRGQTGLEVPEYNTGVFAASVEPVNPCEALRTKVLAETISPSERTPVRSCASSTRSAFIDVSAISMAASASRLKPGEPKLCRICAKRLRAPGCAAATFRPAMRRCGDAARWWSPAGRKRSPRR